MNRNEPERLYGAVEAGRAGAPLYLAPPYQDADEDAEEAKFPLAQYFWILRRYRWRILGAVATAVLATLVLSERLTPIYESTSTVDTYSRHLAVDRPPSAIFTSIAGG